MSDIFISYAHEDQAFVRRMVPALEAEGFSVWWDHTIPPGQSWDSFIARGIAEARCCIVVWSTHSAQSDWVKEEATLAREEGKLLPVQIDNALPPIGFRRIQAAQLKGWNGRSDDAQWVMLVREARSVLARSSDGAAAAPTPNTQASRHPRPAATELPWAVIAGLALVVALLGGGGYFFWSQSQGANTTASAWQSVDTNSATAIRAFLSGAPGDYRDEAQQALAALEERSYEAASDADTIEALEAFLNDFPESQHALAARGRVAELGASQHGQPPQRVTPEATPGRVALSEEAFWIVGRWSAANCSDNWALVEEFRREGDQIINYYARRAEYELQRNTWRISSYDGGVWQTDLQPVSFRRNGEALIVQNGTLHCTWTRSAQ